MRNNLISCVREWPAAVAKMASTQPIIRFSWGLNLWVTLVSPREKYWKSFLVMKQRERRKIFFKKYYWDIVELQCYISFSCTAKWICFTGRFWYNILDCVKKFLFMVDDLTLSDWDEGVKIYPEKQDIHSTRLEEINLNPW